MERFAEKYAGRAVSFDAHIAAMDNHGSYKSCRQAYDLLRAIMNAAVEDELIDTNPVKVKAAAQAQVSRERDLAPLRIPVMFRIADAMPERLRLGVLLGGVLGLRSGEVRALQRRDFSLGGNMPTLTVARAVKEAEGRVEIGALKTARKGIASRTLPIPVALLDAVKAHLRDHTQIGRSGLLFWRASDGDPIRSAAWLKIFKKACAQVAIDLETETISRTNATGEPESDEAQRVRELLTDQGGYIFHGTRRHGSDVELPALRRKPQGRPGHRRTHFIQDRPALPARRRRLPRRHRQEHVRGHRG